MSPLAEALAASPELFPAALDINSGAVTLWHLTEADYAWVTEQIVAVAKRHAQGRIVSSLEGGYSLSALGRSAGVHIRALAEL